MKFLMTVLIGLFFSGSLLAEETKQEVIILLGAPASGKGTHAKFICKELDIPHISTGDILRENIKNKTPLGIEAQKDISQGKLVPDALVLDMLFARLKQKDTQKGYLLDGFPRTVPQAEMYAKEEGNRIRLIVINLNAPDSVLLQRIEDRAKKEGRIDDTPEIAKKRLEVYKQQTYPLIAYYSKQGVLHQVSADASIDEVGKQILTILQTNTYESKPTKPQS